MSQSRTTWIAFVACLSIAGVALGGLTVAALGVERREAAGAVQAENERLALWRMESLLVTLLASENARPPISYQSFYPAGSAYSAMFAPLDSGAVLVPSTLLTYESKYIRLHFQFNPDGSCVSPEVPLGNQRDIS